MQYLYSNSSPSLTLMLGKRKEGGGGGSEVGGGMGGGSFAFFSYCVYELCACERVCIRECVHVCVCVSLSKSE